MLVKQLVSKEAAEQNVTVNGLAATNTWLSGFLSMMVALSQGSTMVVFRKFDVDAVLAGVEKHKITSMYLAPPMVAAVAKHQGARKYDTSSLRVINFSGCNLSPVLQGLAMKKLGCPVVRYYGLTESLLLVFPGPKTAEKPGTVGKVSINIAMKIVDVETGRAVGPNKEGEICFKSPMTFTGYYNNPEATAATIDKDGWVHTGDAGYYDEDGYFYIVDRYKELMKYKNMHVAPGDIENVLTTHEGVRDAAVVGIEHVEDEEHPVGFVVRQDRHRVTAKKLHDFLKGTKRHHSTNIALNPCS
ncbi:hypothetical protein R5R35_009671 [Gryllus longicercus]|uniref:Uncharacterized protein n=1 Tax=Gryllus longicercus TaxID=2509291 RepID=A0AAN9VE07_9ORTH